MAIAGAVDQAAAAALGLGIGKGVGAGGQQAAALRDVDPRQAANPDTRPQRRVDYAPIKPPREADDRRQAPANAPFLAQLIAQSSAPASTTDLETRRLAARQRFGAVVADDPIADAQKHRAAPHRGGDNAEATAEAYNRVKLSVREFAARRYGVARDPDGIFFFQASSIDIST